MVVFRPGPALLFCVLFSSYVSLCSVHTDSFRDFVGGCCLFQAFQERNHLTVCHHCHGGSVFFVKFLFFVLSSRLLDFYFNLFLSVGK